MNVQKFKEKKTFTKPQLPKAKEFAVIAIFPAYHDHLSGKREGGGGKGKKEKC